MEDVTFILRWDEVIGDIISFIKDGITRDEGTAFENIVLKPIIKSSKWIITELWEQLQNQETIIFWNHKIETIFLYIYVGCIMYLGYLCMKQLLKHLIERAFGKVESISFVAVFKKFIILQAIHFICFPMVGTWLELLPQILKGMRNFFLGYQQETITFGTLPSESLFGEAVLLLLLIVLLFVLQLQFIMYHLHFVVIFVNIYIRIVTDRQTSTLLKDSRNNIFQIFIVFILQQFILLEILPQFIVIASFKELVTFTCIVVCICLLPRLMRKRGYNEESCYHIKE